MLRNSRKFNLFDRWRGAFGRWANLAAWLNTVAQALNRAHSLSPLCSLEIGPDGGLEHDFDEAAMLRLARGTHPWMIDQTADGQYHVHGGRVWHAPGAAATVAGADLGTATGRVVLCSTYSGTATEAHTIVAGTTFDYWTTLDKNTWRVATPLGEIAAGEIRQWQHSDLLAPLAPARAAVRFGDTPDELDEQFAYQDGVNAFDATSDVAVRFDILEQPTGATNVKLRARIKDFSRVAETYIDWTSVATIITQYFDWTSVANQVVAALGLARGQVAIDVYDGTTHVKFGYMGGLVDGTRGDATVIAIGDCTS
jgi:hypothetical protein